MKEMNIKGGLNKIATGLDLNRIGTKHQAGSDAYLTQKVFFKLRAMMGNQWEVTKEKIKGKVSGVGSNSFDEDDGYIWVYKVDAEQIKFVDNTGHVNRTAISYSS